MKALRRRRCITSSSIPLKHFQQAIVDIEAVAGAQQRPAFLFDPHRGFLGLANNNNMNLLNGFIEEAHGFFDLLIVDLDYQAAEQLVELILYTMFFFFSDFDCELHEV